MNKKNYAVKFVGDSEVVVFGTVREAHSFLRVLESAGYRGEVSRAEDPVTHTFLSPCHPLKPILLEVGKAPGFILGNVCYDRVEDLAVAYAKVNTGARGSFGITANPTWGAGFYESPTPNDQVPTPQEMESVLSDLCFSMSVYRRPPSLQGNSFLVTRQEEDLGSFASYTEALYRAAQLGTGVSIQASQGQPTHTYHVISNGSCGRLFFQRVGSDPYSTTPYLAPNSYLAPVGTSVAFVVMSKSLDVPQFRPFKYFGGAFAACGAKDRIFIMDIKDGALEALPRGSNVDLRVEDLDFDNPTIPALAHYSAFQTLWDTPDLNFYIKSKRWFKALERTYVQWPLTSKTFWTSSQKRSKLLAV